MVVLAAMEMHIPPPMWWDPHFTLRHATQVIIACRHILARRTGKEHDMTSERKAHAAQMTAWQSE